MQGLGLTVEEFSGRGEDEPGPGIAGKKTGAGGNRRGVRELAAEGKPETRLSLDPKLPSQTPFGCPMRRSAAVPIPTWPG